MNSSNCCSNILKTRFELSNCIAHNISDGIGSFLNLRTILILLQMLDVRDNRGASHKRSHPHSFRCLLSKTTRKAPMKDERLFLKQRTMTCTQRMLYIVYNFTNQLIMLLAETISERLDDLNEYFSKLHFRRQKMVILHQHS